MCIRDRYETITDPEAITEFTYARFALYGVITAYANHIFDWGANPLQTEDDRAGVGVLWARRQPDIPNGADFDRDKAGLNLYLANQGVEVKMQGIELTRSLDGSERVWYLSYLQALE